ncbi:MAG: SMP-30/gluconolactonase/LRE family protein [Planctomycetota bacterium]
MSRFSAIVLFLGWVSSLGWTAAGAAAADSPVPPGAKWERLHVRSAPVSGGLTEGPAAAPDGSIYFSDIASGEHKGRILRFDPRTKKTTVVLKDSRKSNGLMFDAKGRLVMCQGSDFGARRVARLDLKNGEVKVLARDFNGLALNAPNDLCIDVKGRIYFSDPRYVGPVSRDLDRLSVFRFERDGSIVEFIRDVEKPNGVLLSPDQKTLYVADTNNGTDRIDPSQPAPTPGAMRLYAYSLDAKGSLTGRRQLLDFGKETGVDGMTVDVEGRVYLAVRSAKRPGVVVLSPEGKELAYISTKGIDGGVGLPSNCVFGRGVESHVLYVTVGVSLFRVKLRSRGFHLPSQRERSLLKVFRDEFLRIEPGKGNFPSEFQMGSTNGRPNELPVHRVQMSGAFSIAKYEMPQNLWEAVMGHNPSRWKGPRNSAEMFDYDEVVAFNELTTSTMRVLGLIDPSEVIRLPSEVEWEYCARAGTTTKYSFGDDAGKLGGYAWYHGNAAGNDPPVGVKKPNPWGLYDVHGYLWEICADPWAPYNKTDRDSSPAKGGDATRCVLRGGSWKDNAEGLTSSYRRNAARTMRDDAVGFRCVLSKRANAR